MMRFGEPVKAGSTQVNAGEVWVKFWKLTKGRQKRAGEG